MTRKFYNKKEYFVDLEKKEVILEKEFHRKLLNKEFAFNTGFKKIGGSSIGEVLEVDDYSSAFKAFIRLAKLDMPILDTKYIDAGVAIEPLVVAAIEKKLKVKVEVFPPQKYNYDYFKEDPIIGGIPDGFIQEKQLIIEIKTTGEKNFEKWGKNGENLPPKYLKQAQLYAYLKKVDRFSIVATFLKEQDYIDPKNFPIEKRKIQTYAFNVNKEEVEDDIVQIKAWYLEHTTSGVSPKFNSIKDAEILEYLLCENEKQWMNLLEKWRKEGKVKVEID